VGCDIVSWVEIHDPDSNRWIAVRNAFPATESEKKFYGIEFLSSPFRMRHYGLYGFLAGVRNYSCCEPLSEPRGLPEGCDIDRGCAVLDEAPDNDSEPIRAEAFRNEFHSHSWFLLSELLAFDYDKVFWDRRLRGVGHSAISAPEGQGVQLSYRQFLHPNYFAELEVMKGLGEPDRVRVVFCFGD